MKREQLLWEQFVNGDNEALGEVYSELFEPLVFVSYYLVKDNDVARDIVGDLFVSILTKAIDERKMKWEHVNSVKSYLSAAVKNKSIDYLRKNKLYLVSIDSIEMELKEDDNHFYAENLKCLTAHEETFFQLHLDGYKNEELAERYKLSEKTVRNKLSLTRKKMLHYFKSILIVVS